MTTEAVLKTSSFFCRFTSEPRLVQSAAEASFASGDLRPSWTLLLHAVGILNLAIKGTQSWKKLKRGHIFCRLTTRSWCRITLQYELQRLRNRAISYVWSRWFLSTANFSCFLFVNGNTPCKTPKLSERRLFVLDSFFLFFYEVQPEWFWSVSTILLDRHCHVMDSMKGEPLWSWRYSHSKWELIDCK